MISRYYIQISQQQRYVNKILYCFSNRQMSTSSKILQRQLQSGKKTPRRSFNVSTSPHLSPRLKNQQSSSDQSQPYDQDQLLKLQIRQIKRQNRFLKKKVNQLRMELNGNVPSKKRTSKMGLLKQDKDLVHLTVEFFFDQLNSLVHSVINLFRVQFNPEQVIKFTQRFPDQNDELSPVQKYTAVKKFTMNKKLSTIMLEQQEKRYPLLLSIFTHYYRAKQQADLYICKMVDKMTTKALELNKMIVQRAQRKSHRTPKKQYHTEYGEKNTLNNRIHFDDLNLPWKFNRIGSNQINKITEENSKKLNAKKILSPRSKYI